MDSTRFNDENLKILLNELVALSDYQQQKIYVEAFIDGLSSGEKISFLKVQWEKLKDNQKLKSNKEGSLVTTSLAYEVSKDEQTILGLYEIIISNDAEKDDKKLARLRTKFSEHASKFIKHAKGFNDFTAWVIYGILNRVDLFTSTQVVKKK